MLRLLPDEIVELTLVRQEQLVALPVRVQNAIPKKYSITPKPGIRNRQKYRMEAWLGRDLQFYK